MHREQKEHVSSRRGMRERQRLKSKLFAGTRSGRALKTTARSLDVILSAEGSHWCMCRRA